MSDPAATVALRTRKPTGVVPYPMVLLEGEEKAGKSWAAALLSTSAKVGQTYWIDLNEGAADEYGAIPGTRYLVVEHDGTYAQILAAVEAVRAEAQRAKDAGEPPVVLVLDSMTALWDGLKDWVSSRARSKPSNQAKLRQDPAAELDVSRNLWNDAASRHARIMNLLLTFPGIVVVTARGKEVSATDPGTGQPFRDGRKEYRVEGQKGLAFACTVWVRMSRTSRPIVVGARSVHAGIVPGKDDPKPIENEPDILLEWLIFEALKVDPATAQVRDLQTVTGGDLTEEERAAEQGPPQPQLTPAAVKIPAADLLLATENATDEATLLRIWEDRKGNVSPEEEAALRDAIRARKADLEQPPATDAQPAAETPPTATPAPTASAPAVGWADVEVTKPGTGRRKPAVVGV
jgi:hypothetical protein